MVSIYSLRIQDKEKCLLFGVILITSFPLVPQNTVKKIPLDGGIISIRV